VGEVNRNWTALSSGRTIARSRLKLARGAPKERVCGEAQAMDMEIDRVSQMGGVRPEAIPAWQQRENRRRKAEQEAAASEAETEERREAEAVEPAEDRGTLDVMA
jgi:hypothetical protein